MGVRDSIYKDFDQVDLKPQYAIIDDQVKKIIPVVAHQYTLMPWVVSNTKTQNRPYNKVDDTDLEAWLETEQGRWCCKHTQRTPEMIKGYHTASYETMIRVVVFLYEEDATMFHLKWS